MNGHRPRKHRPRSHVIADLSINYLERYIFLCGHSRVPGHAADYGIDLVMWPHGADGIYENGEVKFQVKATDALKVLADGGTISLSLDAQDLDHWMGEIAPVVVVVYDAQTDRAYWLDVKAYGRGQGWRQGSFTTRTLTVRIPMSNRVNRRAIRRIRNLIPRLSENP